MYLNKYKQITDMAVIVGHIVDPFNSRICFSVFTLKVRLFLCACISACVSELVQY